MPLTLDSLRRYAVARSLFAAPTLTKALTRFGFVQADPIRAPARAQDLTLRHRVTGYRAGDLEARYSKLALEEDFFINYGFLPRELAGLMHPRTPKATWPKSRWTQAHAVLEFVRERGVVHPREVDEAFAHGRSMNWFGGTSRASTQLLDGMHYRGLVRTASRAGGIRQYAVRDSHHPVTDVDAALDRLADIVVNLYAPLPANSLSMVVRRIRYGAPQWTGHMNALLARTKARLSSATLDGQRWFWPEGEDPLHRRHVATDDDDTLRLLAPFDPIVWDRRRFELLWGWPYRFEAYTPAPKRLRGYYALPMLWRGQMIGWANATVTEGRLHVEPGFVTGKPPRGAAFKSAWNDEIERLAVFLKLS
ncbi:MAG: YcaQ family DNA glycosylase [Gemmatimonadaceae bacterium]|nr:YcaQ family DNA glycosylase [Gemmatimonadaceae bacterium]